MPAYLLRKTRRNNLHKPGLKLTRFDVDDIRKWARTDGFGLSVAAQVEHLHREFHFVHIATLREVLENGTWTDPSYDREVALPANYELPPVGTFTAFFFLLRLLLGEVLCSPSPSRDH